MELIDFLELIKILGGSISSLMVIAGFFVGLVKPWRNRFVSWVRKTSEVDTQRSMIQRLETKVDERDKVLKESIEGLKTIMQDHVEQDKEKQRLQRILLCSDRDIIRCQITDIYYRYCTAKQLPVYERENLNHLHER